MHVEIVHNDPTSVKEMVRDRFTLAYTGHILRGMGARPNRHSKDALDRHRDEAPSEVCGVGEEDCVKDKEGVHVPGVAKGAVYDMAKKVTRTCFGHTKMRFMLCLSLACARSQCVAMWL